MSRNHILRYRLAQNEVDLIDKVRGSLARSLWMREAALRYAGRQVEGSAASIEKAAIRARSRKGTSNRTTFIRFRLNDDEMAQVNALRGRGKKAPSAASWMREAALRYAEAAAKHPHQIAL